MTTTSRFSMHQWREPSGRLVPVLLMASLVGLVLGCSDRGALDREALMDPAACQSCHPVAYEEWAGSAHAFSSDDPVFRAMNAAGQRATDGALGNFCIECHAPMASRMGLSMDGLNIDELDRPMRGVTCFFCHQVDGIEADHNNGLTIADDTVMRGAFVDPVDTPAHGNGYSPLFDGRELVSSDLCGSCHDVVTPTGLRLERGHEEWKESIFAQPGPSQLSCNGCHMVASEGRPTEAPGVPDRRMHEHGYPGIDVALLEWPGTEEQLALIDRDLAGALTSTLCVTRETPGVDVEVTLDNTLSGHAFPSGVTHNRRVWVELVAYSGEDVVYQSGVVAEGEAVAELEDPDLWLIRSRLLGEDGEEADSLTAVSSDNSLLIPPATTLDPTDPAFFHARSKTYSVPQMPDRITMRVFIRPVGLEILDELIASGDLDEEVRAMIPTHEVRFAAREWTDEVGFDCVP